MRSCSRHWPWQSMRHNHALDRLHDLPLDRAVNLRVQNGEVGQKMHAECHDARAHALQRTLLILLHEAVLGIAGYTDFANTTLVVDPCTDGEVDAIARRDRHGLLPTQHITEPIAARRDVADVSAIASINEESAERRVSAEHRQQGAFDDGDIMEQQLPHKIQSTSKCKGDRRTRPGEPPNSGVDLAASIIASAASSKRPSVNACPAVVLKRSLVSKSRLKLIDCRGTNELMFVGLHKWRRVGRVPPC